MSSSVPINNLDALQRREQTRASSLLVGSDAKTSKGRFRPASATSFTPRGSGNLFETPGSAGVEKALSPLRSAGFGSTSSPIASSLGSKPSNPKRLPSEYEDTPITTFKRAKRHLELAAAGPDTSVYESPQDARVVSRQPSASASSVVSQSTPIRARPDSSPTQLLQERVRIMEKFIKHQAKIIPFVFGAADMNLPDAEEFDVLQSHYQNRLATITNQIENGKASSGSSSNHSLQEQAQVMEKLIKHQAKVIPIVYDRATSPVDQEEWEIVQNHYQSRLTAVQKKFGTPIRTRTPLKPLSSQKAPTASGVTLVKQTPSPSPRKFRTGADSLRRGKQDENSSDPHSSFSSVSVPTSPTKNRGIAPSKSVISIHSEDDFEAMWGDVANISDDDDLGEIAKTPATAVAVKAKTPTNQTLESVSEDVSTPSRQSAVSGPSSSPSQGPYYEEAVRILRRTFKLELFRPNQFEAIAATLSKKDVFVLMPTGGGKSLCYQLPALCKSGQTSGVTVVVSPLKSLMADQVHHLKNLHIDVVAYSGDDDKAASSATSSRLRSYHKPTILYTTPEKMQCSAAVRDIFGSLYSSRQIARFVIDEAHCISSWGRDFRQAYQTLGELRELYPEVPLMALTATAKEVVVKDIISKLGMKDCVQLKTSFNRPNLNYLVMKKSMKSVVADLAEWIASKHHNESGVVYCYSKKDCEVVAKQLRDVRGLKAEHYHAGMTASERECTQSAWQEGKVNIIVATIAFGMGIDKADVRFVVHHSLPKSLDGYYQETGRAGRDGLPADCLLYYTYADVLKLHKLIDRDDQDNTILLTREDRERLKGEVRTVAQYAANVTDCRRSQVLQYFGERFSRELCNRLCDNCQNFDGNSTKEDRTNIAVHLIQIVDTVCRENVNLTAKDLFDAYRGANNDAIRKKSLQKVEYYGAGKGLDSVLIDRVIQHCLAWSILDGYEKQNSAGYSNEFVQLGARATDVLMGELPVLMAHHKTAAPKARKTSKVAEKRSAGRVDSGGPWQVKENTVKAVEGDRNIVASRTLSGAKDGDADDIEDDTGIQSKKQKRSPDETIDSASSDPRLANRTEERSTSDVNHMEVRSSRCLAELKSLREEIEKEGHDVDFLHDRFLWALAVLLPRDTSSFRRELNDFFGENQATEIWDVHGKRLLSKCVRLATGAERKRVRSLSVDDTTTPKTVIDRSKYILPASTAPPHTIAASKFKPTSRLNR